MITIPTEATPLAWPNGKPRTATRIVSPFFRRGTNGRLDRTPLEGIQIIHAELARMHATSVVISSNLPIRRDGRPYSEATAQPGGDPGAAVYWALKQGRAVVPYCIPCDTFQRVGCNLYAIGASIEALRKMDRYGAVSLQQAFAGFAALPPGSSGSAPVDWRSILGGTWDDDAPRDEVIAIAKLRFRRLADAAHPDHGGDTDRMATLNLALAAVEDELG